MITIGIVGTKWGLMHVGGFRAAGATVVGLCGRDQAKTEAIAAREHIGFHTSSLEALCEVCDAIVIASPDSAHAAHVRIALEHGRHVLCEKPLTRTWAESKAVLEHARTVAQVCAVNLPYRQLPSFTALKRWLEPREATLRSLVVTMRNSFARGEPDAADGSMLGLSGDFGGVSHVLDAALWLSGREPVSVQASLRGRPIHSVELHLALERDVHLSLSHLPCAEPGIHGRWSLQGEGWEAELNAGYQPEWGGWRLSEPRVFERGWSALAVAPGSGDREPWAQAHVETARAFLAMVEGRLDRGDLATFAHGARVQHVLDAAMHSERSGLRQPLSKTT